MLKKITILVLALFLFSPYSNAQTMTSKNLLDNLVPHWDFLESLREELSASTGIEYTAVLRQAYSFIQLELEDEEGQIFLQIKYQIQTKNKLSLYSFYCDNKNMATQLEEQAEEQMKGFEWDSPSKSTFKLTDQSIQYLEIADRVAAVGDDVNTYPSFYSALILTNEGIKLEQINRKNSRSIDHKDSYFLRDLYFLIPLKNDLQRQNTSKIGSYFIGDMEVLFNDSSAKSQRGTGDKIRLRLTEEIKTYK